MTPPKFASLYQRAISEWPDVVNLATLKRYSGDRYTVAGLPDVVERIENTLIGADDEVVVQELHWCINIIIHALAANLLEVKPSHLRPEAVETIFKKRLRKSVAMPDDLRWTAEDVALAQTYLADDDSDV